MKTFKLIREGGTEAIAQACGQCGRVYQLNDAFAERCCDKALQEQQREEAWAASRAKAEAAEKEHIANARRVAEASYKGPVFSDGLGYREGYFADTDELREWCEDQDRELPGEAWACFGVRFSLPKADEIVERRVEEGEWHEDISDQLTDTVELQDAIDAWNARQTAETWFINNRIRVVLEPAGVKA